MADNSFIAEKASNTPEPYRFRLLNPDTSQEVTLKVPPIEWADGTIELKRDINIGGVFTSFVTDSLTFLKEGAKFLRDIWDEKEMNGKCDLIVEYLTFPNEYTEMPSRFSLNFATAKPRVKVGNQSIGFLIEATKNDILVKLENRRDKDVDISKRYITVDSEGNNKEYIKTIGGSELLPYSELPYLGLKKVINFDSLNLNFNTSFVSNYTDSGQIDNNEDYHVYTQFDMIFSGNDFGDEANEVNYKTNITNLSSVENCFNNTTEKREITFYYGFTIEVTNRKGGIFDPTDTYAVFLEVIEGTTIISSERVADVGSKTGRFQFSVNKNFTLEIGHSIRIYIRTDDTSGINAYIRESFFKITQDVAQYGGDNYEGFPIYEAFERTLQHVTDIQFPFYSEFFGRLDTVYNLNSDVYSSENQLRFAHVLSGLNLRGAELFVDNNPLSLNFDDLFESVNSIYNIGYEEYSTGDGFERIRIENYSYFFNDSVVLDLSDRLSIYDIESESMPDLAYAQIKTGFEDYSYERINGRGEFNTESSFTSIINTDTSYEIVSKLRADTMGISEKITQELTNEDTEEDNELFIIKTQRSELENADWKPEKQENITIEDESSLFGVDSFNLYYSPARMLKRHGNRIKSALLKYLSSSFRFQKSDKLQTLKTTGEGFTIKENDDILVNDLDDSIWKPIKHTVTCKFTFEDFETLLTNKKGLIKFSNDISGYLLSFTKTNNEDRATIEIIEKA